MQVNITSLATVSKLNIRSHDVVDSQCCLSAYAAIEDQGGLA